MAQKLFLTGPGSFSKAERKEALDGLDRISCVSLFQSEMVLGRTSIVAIITRRKYSECVRVRVLLQFFSSVPSNGRGPLPLGCHGSVKQFE